MQAKRAVRPLGWIGIFVLFWGLSGSQCQSGIGDPCIPESEYDPTFSGFAAAEVNLESRSLQCATRLCLVNHFQGRSTCPYGQSESTVTGNGPEKERCHTPGGADPENRVTVPVPAQLAGRRADDAVYCSCRCAGTDPDARYCQCPSGFDCVDLWSSAPKLGSKELAGSYCVKRGTAYDPADAAGAACTLVDPAADPPGTCGPFD